MFERKIELRETVYYDCSVDPEHRHKGEDAARRCFDRNQNKGPKKDHIERNIRIMEAYITGDETPQEIAERTSRRAPRGALARRQCDSGVGCE